MTLDQWLAHLEKLHPATIELGLARVQAVADRLPLDFTDSRIITVAGTNGKGSSVALLSAILREAGYRVGTYTSPHILVYNERVCIDGSPVGDEALCASFAAVEAARQGISLTYFEFGTLAALHLFAAARLDFLVLEVGLGGRLDAVNIVDPDLAILTNVALDHMEWLGDTREAIGHEKAGIFRAGRPALYGESDMPTSVRKHAQSIAAQLQQQGSDFGWQQVGDDRWQWFGCGREGRREYRDLAPTLFNLDNVATVLQALLLLTPEITQEQVKAGVAAAVLPGRLQLFPADPERSTPATVLDVAHNPHAVGNLVRNLAQHFPGRELRLVIAMLGDKDSAGVVSLLSGLDARWYIAQINGVRGSSSDVLYRLAQAQGVAQLQRFDSVAAAYAAACEDAGDNTLVLVTGSFFTVSAIMAILQ